MDLYPEEAKNLISIPKYSLLERKIKNESNDYKRNKEGNIYRFYLGKYKTKAEFEDLKTRYTNSFLIKDCLEDSTYLKLKREESYLLFHRLGFYNISHLERYLFKINNNHLKVAVFDGDDKLLNIYSRKGF